jgi:ATP-dependent exoDNAse (exonuclease V) alpha subunit
VVYLLGYLSGISLTESQLPLRLASALTIHKSQNYTSKSMGIDIDKSERTAGVLYVAISRVKSL